MAKTVSFKVADKLYLVQRDLSQEAPVKAKPVEIPTNHFAIIDCSGSMSWDLPKIREQLKKKLPKLLKEQDTITVIWFSGRGQFGTLLEAEPVATLADLQVVEQSIDRWLKPVGMTGFVEPLREAAKVVERVAKKRAGSTSALFFMSDGCDNQWSRSEIIQAIEKAAGGFSSSTFVEYGYYADRPLLTAMAEKAGGTLIFSEDFDRYAPQFEAALQKKVSGAKRLEVPVEGDPIGGFIFAMDGNDLITYAVEGGNSSVSGGTSTIFYLSPSPIGSSASPIGETAERVAKGEKGLEETLNAIYAAVSLFAIRMKSSIVLPLLKALGDVALIEQFSTCFGKQKYSAFMDVAKAAAFGAGRFTKGWDPKRVPREDAFTVLDVLYLLSQDENNRVLMEHPEFKYSRIGRGRTDAGEALTPEELAEVSALTAKMASEKNAKKIKELTDKIASITNNKKSSLKFVADPAPDGYSISNLTWNEDRPNVSFMVRKPGTVDLGDRLPSEFKGKIPESFPTFVFRNYAVIKDGLVNIDKLPVKISEESFSKLCAEGVLSGAYTPVVVIDLKALPVINQKMVKEVSAKSFFTRSYELIRAQATSKVLNAYSKELLPARKSEGFASKYGDDGAAWLKEQGFTDYSGFSPKTVQAESTDVYMGKELKVSIKGLSSLPSLKDVKKAMTTGKLNAGAQLMKSTVEEVEKFLSSEFYTKAAQKERVLEAWLEGQTKAAKTETRRIIFDIAQTTFSLIVGQVWFSEFSSLDENSMTLTIDGNKIDCKAEMREVEIKI